MRVACWLVSVAFLLSASCATSGERAFEGQVHWRLDSLNQLGDQPTTVVGAPRLIETPKGPAVEFDGENDALFVDQHPLEGMTTFTVEVVFRPDANGAKAQRFFHMHEDGGDNRVMFETRLTDDGRWFLDTFILSGDSGVTLYAEDFKHPVGPWYHAAITVDGAAMKHYVNGDLELSAELDYAPQGPGRTSLGVRINKVHWYKGAVREARFTPRVLKPDEFLEP